MGKWKKFLIEKVNGHPTEVYFNTDKIGSSLIGKPIEATYLDHIGNIQCVKGKVKNVLEENVKDTKILNLLGGNY